MQSRKFGPYEEMIANDVVWVGMPADVIERIEICSKAVPWIHGGCNHR